MKIAIVGCGYVADFYMTTLPNHPDLDLVGVHDRDPAAARRFSEFHGVPAFSSLSELLNQARPDLVLNLTNPRSHYDVSRECIGAGFSVYSEKPMGMNVDEAQGLVRLAAERGVHISCAPCSILGDACQTLLREIREGRIGRPVLAYAEMEDGMVFTHPWRKWRSKSGAPWPGIDEFEIGCTLEHAGYYLTWLCAIFGPAVEVTAFGAKLFSDKTSDTAPENIANDYSVTCLRFQDGAVARLTCGLVAPNDRSLHIQGDKGILSVTDGWNYSSSVYLRPVDGDFGFGPKIFRRIANRLLRSAPFRHWFGKRVGARDTASSLPKFPSRMDFMRGPAEMARAIADGRPLPISADFSMHVTELALVAQNPDQFASPYRPVTSFDPLPAR